MFKDLLCCDSVFFYEMILLIYIVSEAMGHSSMQKHDMIAKQSQGLNILLHVNVYPTMDGFSVHMCRHCFIQEPSVEKQ